MLGVFALGPLALAQHPTANDVAPPSLYPIAQPTSQAAGTSTVLALGLVGAGLLVLAVLLAMRARRPVAHRAPRRSFEAGRALGLAANVASESDALDALERSPVGHAQRAAVGPGIVRATVVRKRSESCDMVAGYLCGLMERAWASDVEVRHTNCVGNKKAGTCDYDLRRTHVKQ